MSTHIDLSERLTWPFFGDEHRTLAELVSRCSRDALMSRRMRGELLRILAQERHTVMLITHDVEEAIHLADRILVLSPRPTRIRVTFDVPLPHPRRLSSSRVQELRGRDPAAGSDPRAARATSISPDRFRI